MGIHAVSPAFVLGDRWPGASKQIAHSLAMIDCDTPTIHRLREMFAKLRIKNAIPAYKPNAWAHLGLPNLRVAILVMGNQDRRRAAQATESWAPYSWRVMAVSERSLERLTDEEMTSQFVSGLKVLGKLK